MTLGTVEERGSPPRSESESMDHVDAKLDADQYVIGTLVQMLAFGYEDSASLGEEIFSLIRAHGSRTYGDDSENMRVFQERVDYYARRWQRGAWK